MQQVTGPILPPELNLTSEPSIPWAACFPLFGRLRRDASVEGLIGKAKVSRRVEGGRARTQGSREYVGMDSRTDTAS